MEDCTDGSGHYHCAETSYAKASIIVFIVIIAIIVPLPSRGLAQSSVYTLRNSTAQLNPSR